MKIKLFLKKIKLWIINHKIVTSLVMFSLIILFVTPYVLNEYKRYARRGDDILVEYLNLDENHVYEKISLDEFNDLQSNKETFVIYMGYKDCQACQTNVPLANEIFKEKGIEKVYYYNFDYSNEFEQNVYENKIYDFIGTPIFVYFIDGEYIFSNQSPEFRKSGDPIIVSIELATNEYLKRINQ